MSKIGGYLIFDFENDAFTLGTAKTVPGAYKAFTGNKPVLIEGLKVGTNVFSPFFSPMMIPGTNKITSRLNPFMNIEITKEDAVKLTSVS